MTTTLTPPAPASPSTPQPAPTTSGPHPSHCTPPAPLPPPQQPARGHRTPPPLPSPDIISTSTPSPWSRSTSSPRRASALSSPSAACPVSGGSCLLPSPSLLSHRLSCLHVSILHFFSPSGSSQAGNGEYFCFYETIIVIGLVLVVQFQVLQAWLFILTASKAASLFP